jgi:uncharacterized protein (TIGR03067 family)
MNRRLSFALLGVLLIAAGPREEQVHLAPAASLDGTWRILGYERDSGFDRAPRKYRAVIRGERMTLTVEDTREKPHEYRLTFPAGDHPSAVNLVSNPDRNPRGPADVTLGIYLLQGSSLKFYWGNASKRPAAFKLSDDAKTVTVLERIGP